MAMLLPSSSVMVVSAMLGGLVVDSEAPALGPLAEPLICCISYVICSVFISFKTLLATVGRRASTVNVQSSWFCSNRRRKLYHREGDAPDHVSPTNPSRQILSITEKHWAHSLLLSDAITTHTLTRVVDLVQDKLGSDVAGTDNANTNGNGSPVVAQPAPRGQEHGAEAGKSCKFE